MSMLLEYKIDTDKIIYVYRPDMQREKTLINKPGTGSWKILILVCVSVLPFECTNEHVADLHIV